ncbi:YqfQ family protein [Neobacillus thermocopriae]|nr:YqfQ family protein [Neobacillus thermocopriae]MED3624797.1 YqfQ family protein [Neobacillus thermocopriae]MED3715491.1 YqfQ family protein [Neobacillus thermocopriae]
MQQRTMFPIQRGMGPSAFTGRNPMMRFGTNSFANGRPMMGPGFIGVRRPMMGPRATPFGGMMGRQHMGGGGLLSSLFGRKNSMGSGFMGMPGAGGAQRTGGLLQSLTSPGGLNNFLNNTQQVLKTAQTLGPMIQQYGPLVKNLPALWKLYRGLKNADTNETTNTEKTEPIKDESTSFELSDKKKKKKSASDSNTRPQNTVPKGTSVPKLYV